MSEANPETAQQASAGPIHDWAAQLAAALQAQDADVDVPLLLDVARDVAHAVNRPAVPITMFLLGYAAAEGGGSAAAVEAACSRTQDLARRWASQAGSEA
jgi:hypothetical protein